MSAQVCDGINFMLKARLDIVQRTNFGGIGMKFGFLDTYHPEKFV
ncbi:hypothetical protein [Rhizobium sp.]